MVLDVWSGRWRGIGEWLQTVEATLRSRQAVVLRGSTHDRWDLEVRGGHAGIVRLSTCIEEHGHGRQLLRFRLLARTSASGFVFVSLFTALGVWAVSDSAWTAAALLAVLGAAFASRAVHECGVATAAVIDAIETLGTEADVAVLGRGGGQRP
jgi:hypothetical protein